MGCKEMKENRKQPPINTKNDYIQQNINNEENPIKQSDIPSPKTFLIIN